MLLHVGMPKTGTTFLQHRIFGKDPNILNLFRFHQTHTPGYDEIIALNNGDPFSSEQLRSAIDAVIEQNPEKSAILSWEDLSQNKRVTYREIAEALKLTFPDAEIVITLREPISFSVSLYTQWLRPFVKGVTTRKFISFDEWVRKTSPRPYGYQHDLVSHYLDLFDDVRVCLYEEMKANFSSYMRRFWPNIPVSDNKLHEYAESAPLHLSLTNEVVDFITSFRTPERPDFRENLERYKSVGPRPVVEILEGRLAEIISDPGDPVVASYEIVKDLLAQGTVFEPVIPADAKSMIVGRTAAGLRKIDQKFSLNMRKFGYEI